MSMGHTTRRRLVGAAALAAALLMILAGQTVLKGRLGGMVFLAYWLVCLLLTFLAIGVAFYDAYHIQRETLKERRELIESTLKEVETKMRQKRDAGPPT